MGSVDTLSLDSLASDSDSDSTVDGSNSRPAVASRPQNGRPEHHRGTRKDSGSTTKLDTIVEPDTHDIVANDKCSYMSAEDLLEHSDKLPSSADLREANEIPLFGRDGKRRFFSELYADEEHYGQRQLLIFVRHVFCKACQNYLRTLSEYITPATYLNLPMPTTITIITCGTPSLINQYADQTTCPFPIYTEPTRRLYKILGLTSSASTGKRPKYSQGETAFKTMIKSFALMGRQRPFGAVPKGGNWFQLGGEFLFERSRPIWCHRMTDARNHAEMSTIGRILGHCPETDDEGSEAGSA